MTRKCVPSPLRGEVRRSRGEGPLCTLIALATLACTPTQVPTPATTPKPTSSAIKRVATLRAPAGLDLDRAGTLHITTPTAIHRHPGTPLEADLDAPLGVAVRRDGTVLVADTRHHRIRAIAPDGTATTLAGDGTSGFADGPGATARFASPTGLALDALDAVIVADTGNHRLRRIARDGAVTTLAGAGPGLVDGELAQARFTAPADVAVDARGRLYVADLENHAVRVVDEAAGTVRTLAGNGQPGDADGTARQARFHYPTGLAVDGDGAVYVADSQNQAVRKAYPDGRVVTIARGTFVPTDVAVTAAGKVYVSDSAAGAVFTLE